MKSILYLSCNILPAFKHIIFARKVRKKVKNRTRPILTSIHKKATIHFNVIDVRKVVLLKYMKNF